MPVPVQQACPPGDHGSCHEAMNEEEEHAAKAIAVSAAARSNLSVHRRSSCREKIRMAIAASTSGQTRH